MSQPIKEPLTGSPSREPISEGERRGRQADVDYGRATCALSGIYLSAETERLYAQYVAGEMTNEELAEKLLVL